MSHAGQLLAESPGLSDEDRRLTEIMQPTPRASAASSTTCCGCRAAKRREPERLPLAAWIASFREEFCETMQLPAEAAC